MAKKVGIAYQSEFLKHEANGEHPERPERLRQIIKRLRESSTFAKLKEIPFHEADEKWIARIHTPSYITRVREFCQRGYPTLDLGETYLNLFSFSVANLAVGACLAAGDWVANNQLTCCFCCIRPPGHHAESDHGGGFCIFNNIAILARYLQEQHHFERVAIVDWDVHHGNGTQNSFYDDPAIFFFSIHQFPHFPGSGDEEEIGVGAGKGFNLNVTLAAGAGDQEYVRAFKEKFVPAMEKFKPQIILISAGFDAHRDDPLSDMQMTEYGFQQLTEIVRQVAIEYSRGRIISLLEGGYNLDALANSVDRHISALLQE